MRRQGEAGILAQTCRISRDTLSGRSEESTTPFTKDSQRGIRSSSNSSLMNTRFTKSRMLRLFFSQSCAARGPRACQCFGQY